MTPEEVPRPSVSRRPAVIPVVFVQQQAAVSTPQRAAPDAVRAEQLLRSVLDSDKPPAVAWNEAFEDKAVGSGVLAIAFAHLRKDNRHDDVIAGLEAAIRNDHAQPWMYDVLALEMKIAGRPQQQIDRVLTSRIDFAPGNQAQMLVTASMLAGFDAFDRAIEICREAAKRTPWEPTVWAAARKIADRSKDPESVIWSRAGTIQHVWSGDYKTLHEICEIELEDLERQLTTDGKAALASKLRNEKQAALQRDIRITIQWTGDADLDLSVIEPDGQRCSRKVPLTANGGLLIQQSDGGKERGTHVEEYVCPIAKSGDYTVQIQHIHGRVIRGAVTIRQVRYENSGHEIRSQLIETGVVENNITVRIPVNRGRARQ